MIRFNFDLTLDQSFLPQWKDNNDIFFRHGSFGWWPKKHWEIQVAYWGLHRIFEFTLDLRFRGSHHAGPRFEIGVFGLWLAVTMHDERHWDYDNNCWEEYDPEEDQEAVEELIDWTAQFAPTDELPAATTPLDLRKRGG